MDALASLTIHVLAHFGIPTGKVATLDVHVMVTSLSIKLKDVNTFLVRLVCFFQEVGRALASSSRSYFRNDE
jgi:hypothetical protein